MNLQGIFKKVKENVRIYRDIEISDISIKMEPPTALEEVKILTACKDFEGPEYINGIKLNSLAYSIKKINEYDLSENEYTYTNENGEKETLSKYLFMMRQIEQWPTSVRDVLFDAFTDMQNEMDDKVKEMAKFKRYKITTESAVEEPESKFKKVKVKEDEGLTEVEKLNRQVEKEIDQANSNLSSSEDKALNGQK